MAEYIDRQALEKALMIAAVNGKDRDRRIWAKAICVLHDMETADAVPVVRCKNCTHYKIVDEFDGGKRYMCKVNHFSYINSDGDMHYCSYGERKDGVDNA